MKTRTFHTLALAHGCLALLCVTPAATANQNSPDQAKDRVEDASLARPSTVTVDPKAGVEVMPMDEDARELIERLVDVSTQEVQISRIASERATTPGVKSFAQEMVSAHTATLDELRSLLSTAGHASAQGSARRADDREWTGKDADEFDEDYMEKMVELHEENLDALEDASESSLPQLRAHAQRQTPAVEGHLKRAKTLAEEVD